MSQYKVFIDGSAGTTGLRIRERLAGRADMILTEIEESERKNPSARKEFLNSADIVFLCLPDDAAREAVSMIENENVTVIDASTAHRTAPGWAYGFPELSDEFESRIRNSKRIAVPGCHASGFIALVYPLISAGAISRDALLTCHSLTGYSGGGKKMIAEYESEGRDPLLSSPRQYGISQNHKHLKEMTAICTLSDPPLFSPIVADFYSGMEVTVPIFAKTLNGATAEDIKKIYRELYTGPIVKYAEESDEAGFLASSALSGKDSMEISVFGSEERILLTARYDNLGKGASGAAVECLNIVTGADKTRGLEL